MIPTQANSRSAARRPQAGLSLIELMIAIALGALLLLGLVQIFGGVRNTFGTNEALSRIQENSRFALEFIRRDVRMAGHFGCLNEFGHIPQTTPRPTEPQFVNYFVAPNANRDTVFYTLRADVPLEIYDYNAVATGPGDTFTIASDTPTPPNAAGNWTPALPADLGITAGALPGSDVIVVRYFDEELISVTGGMPNAGTGDIVLDATTITRVVDGGVYGVTNCLGAGLFAVTGITGNNINVNGAPNTQRAASVWWNDTDVPVGIGTLMFRYRMAVYYVGLGVNGPALMRRTLPEAGHPTATAANQIVLGPAEEVVEGVEMMQVLAGVDTSSPRDDVTDAYRSGSALLATPAAGAPREDALRQINSVRISLLMRGNQSRANIATPGTQNVGDVRVTVPADGRVRQTYDTVIALRNRLRA
jgi:type IV pilus assembly protein PilW